MRVIGLFIVGFSIAIIGFHIVYKNIARYNQLKQIDTMIGNIKQSIKYKKLPVVDIFVELKSLNKIDFLTDECISNFEIDFKKMCFENKELLILNDQKMILFEFLSGLGKTDVAGQEEFCEHYKRVFNELIQNAKIEKDKKVKLYPSLFMLFGILVIIVLI